MERITSRRNPRVLEWRALKDRDARETNGLFIAEGVKMLREAISSSSPIEAILIRDGENADILPREISDTIPLYQLSEDVFDSVCTLKTKQSTAAIVRLTSRPASGPRLVALDHVQDPGNVGTIIRTADAAGMDGVILTNDSSDPFSPKALRASMGSIFRVGISTVHDLPSKLAALRGQGYSVICSALGGEPFYSRHDINGSFALVIGNEGNGISDAVKAEATHILALPMPGGAESLNAAAAASIMMYDLAVRQLNNAPEEQFQ